mgnify:FL=1|jgi:hypothetical protein|tara:strand:+ start:1853 stop:2110 length:258 start_codon:yes stop_codon:yes gene_type:complete
MMKNMESLNDLKDNDKYIVTVTVWKNQQMNTNCYVHNFPTKDLPIARNDITTLIHETYLKDSMVTQNDDQQNALNNDVKNLLTEE